MPTSKTAATGKPRSSAREQTVRRAASYRTNGNGLELSLSRALVGEAVGTPAFDFHWADNIQGFATVAELGVNGDSAPNRRWNYRFEVGEARLR